MADATALQGRIIAVHGRHYTVEFSDGSLRKCFPRGKKAGAAVGDHVVISPQGADEGSIDRILERRNLLYRSDDMRTKQFAANVDQLLIVVAPEPVSSDDLIGRALVAAWSAGIEPIIVLNKIDLENSIGRARERLSTLKTLGVHIIELSAHAREQMSAALLPQLSGRCTLLLGQSGMGKSTILNALVPDARAHTQEHSQALGAGKHTTTSTRLYHLPGNAGDIIDSPGFQAFGLYHLSATEIEQGFPEFADAIPHCRFYNCTHRHEPGCGVLAAIKLGTITSERHELYKRILAENEAQGHY
ncbi:ribosome small subunit-dependent GTPase A [Candidimonas sp. SYP-B2681]|uniref:ribosome small subunit-dependent GTPase A n=1 Tax=Candidimonas sp. SYP-B2681 TaxID=2497686 RepID=UPI000F86779E|nr:ribosome small subunit-dependent GTPase A [Candidimonas sp. SYP-B2681]RTZ41006.1 ribosome small subunit-dependent GTPase A [Candidimonas sp. SYP-B2681]